MELDILDQVSINALSPLLT